MRGYKHKSSVPGSLIAVMGIVLGVALTVIFLRYAPLSILPNPPRRPALEASLLAALVFVLALALFLGARANRYNKWVRGLLSAFLDYIPDNVFFKDRQSRFVLISRSMAEYFGLGDPSDAVGKTDRDVFSSEHAEQAMADEAEIVRTGKPAIGIEEKETWPDGRESWVLTTKIPLHDGHGNIVGTMGISHNITDRRRTQAQIRHMALHDALTGLPNRVFLMDYLTQAIVQAQAAGASVTVMMLDLDSFKEVNDTMGHQAGDLLLEAVARRLKSSLRENDCVARLGGDEFIFALPASGADPHASLLASKVLATLSQPLHIQSREVRISGSIGIAQFPQDGLAPEPLLQAADAAMYEAKARGCGHFCFWSTDVAEARRAASQECSNCCSPLIETVAASATEIPEPAPVFDPAPVLEPDVNAFVPTLVLESAAEVFVPSSALDPLAEFLIPAPVCDPTSEVHEPDPVCESVERVA